MGFFSVVPAEELSWCLVFVLFEAGVTVVESVQHQRPHGQEGRSWISLNETTLRRRHQFAGSAYQGDVRIAYPSCLLYSAIQQKHLFKPLCFRCHATEAHGLRYPPTPVSKLQMTNEWMHAYCYYISNFHIYSRLKLFSLVESDSAPKSEALQKRRIIL